MKYYIVISKRLYETLLGLFFLHWKKINTIWNYEALKDSFLYVIESKPRDILFLKDRFEKKINIFISLWEEKYCHSAW
jgi:hypothetical protein